MASLLSSPDSEEAWGGLVRDAAYAENAKFAGSKLATVEWLLAEAAPYRFSLKPVSKRIFDALDFCYKQNVDDPETVKLFEKFIARGADPQMCNGALCPLWYAARFQKLAHVKFLLGHGTAAETVNRVQDGYGTTPLGEAVVNGDSAIAGILLDAGAKITHGQYQDDVVSACSEKSSRPAEATRELIGTLKRHGVHISKPNSRITRRGRSTNPSWHVCRSSLRTRVRLEKCEAFSDEDARKTQTYRQIRCAHRHDLAARTERDCEHPCD